MFGVCVGVLVEGRALRQWFWSFYSADRFGCGWRSGRLGGVGADGAEVVEEAFDAQHVDK